MRFELIDAIEELERGRRIVAVKAVTLAEEYLADHFPTFPVMPGVLMLQAMVEAAAWLVRDAEGFASSIILLSEAKNVTYKSFVKPGRLLRVDVRCRRLAAGGSEFDGTCFCAEKEVARARFSLSHFRASDHDPALDQVDRDIVAAARARYEMLRR